MVRRDAPRVLFFHRGSVCSDAGYDMAYTIGSNIGFRNADAANNEGSLEPAVAVSAVEPADIPLPYYQAYPYVTTARELARAANGVLKADANPPHGDDEDLETDDDDDLDLDGPDLDEELTGTEYDRTPYTPDTSKTDEENAKLKEEWDQKELERLAMLPARDTLAVDHPAYKAPSGPKRRRIKDPNARRARKAAKGGTADEPNAPQPPATAPAWNNNA
jgi:hypothetical protein